MTFLFHSNASMFMFKIRGGAQLNVALAALTGGCYTTGMTLGTFPAGGRTDYGLTNNAIVTSATGDATFWLFPTSPSCPS